MGVLVIHVHLDFMNCQLMELRVEGHQQKRPTGESLALICNAISVIVQNFQEALLQLVSKTDFELQNRKGLCIVSRKSKHRLDNREEQTLDTIVKVSLIGFKRLEKQHPEYIRVHLKDN